MFLRGDGIRRFWASDIRFKATTITNTGGYDGRWSNRTFATEGEVGQVNNRKQVRTRRLLLQRRRHTAIGANGIQIHHGGDDLHVLAAIYVCVRVVVSTDE